jgi:hypothetical protein
VRQRYGWRALATELAELEAGARDRPPAWSSTGARWPRSRRRGCGRARRRSCARSGSACRTPSGWPRAGRRTSTSTRTLRLPPPAGPGHLDAAGAGQGRRTLGGTVEALDVVAVQLDGRWAVRAYRTDRVRPAAPR